MDSVAKLVRWLVACLCLGAAYELPERVLSPTGRVCVGLVGLVFLIWPNAAYHLTSLLRFVHLVPRQPGGPGASDAAGMS